MSEAQPNPLASQIDYNNWPKGELFDRKRAILERIEQDFYCSGQADGGFLTYDEFEYIWGKANHFWMAFNHCAEQNIRFQTELALKDIEIDSLKSQLERR